MSKNYKIKQNEPNHYLCNYPFKKEKTNLGGFIYKITANVQKLQIEHKKLENNYPWQLGYLVYYDATGNV